MDYAEAAEAVEATVAGEQGNCAKRYGRGKCVAGMGP